MKKKQFKELSLNKKSVSNLNSENLKGGLQAFTDGCSDGCTPFQTALNCTRANCTADCDNGNSGLCQN